MKTIKKHFLSIAALLFSMMSFGQQSKQMNDAKNEVLQVAQAKLLHNLEKIPNGDEIEWGFNSRDEFSLAQLGTPYQIYILNSEFYNDSVIENKNYIITKNEWLIPVKVNGEYKTLVMVSKFQGEWSGDGIGSAGLARELHSFEKEHPLSGQAGMLLDLSNPWCRFILMNDATGIKAIPVSSSIMAFELNEKNNSEFTLDTVLKMIKFKSK